MMDTSVEGLGFPKIIQKLSCTTGTPNKIDFLFQFGDHVVEFSALIFTPEIAYSIVFKTSFENLEEFTISGQFGSTALKSIYSFKNHRTKRSIDLEYDQGNGGFKFDADLPFIKFKRFAFRGDRSTARFTLDQGRDFAINIQYNLSSVKAFGDFSMNLQYARYEANYTVTLVYEVPDEDLSKGLHAKFTFPSPQWPCSRG